MSAAAAGVPGGQALLEVRGVSRAFGGVRAVEDVSLMVRPGEIMALIGPNGAGKTTLLNVLSGVIRPDSGQVIFDGCRTDVLPPHRVARLGLARTFQNLRLFPTLSVLENVAAVLAHRGAGVRGLLRPASEPALQEAARTLLRRVGLDEVRDAAPRSLPYGLQRQLEIARALALAPRMLLLDEPAAGLTHAEVDAVVRLVRALRDEGRTVLLIEHHMGVVRALADRVAVLDHGQVIALGPLEQVAADPRVVEAYLGA